MEKSCINCNFFESFRDSYYDDMEPDDQGYCRNGKSKYFGNEGAGYITVCPEYEEIGCSNRGSEFSNYVRQ